MSRFISIDPSSVTCGWAVFEGQGLIAWGTITTEGATYAARFVVIVEQLEVISEMYGVREIAIEDVTFAWRGTNRNRNIAGLQVVSKSVRDWAGANRLPLARYNVGVWKNAVVGHRHASKETTAENVCLRFPSLPTDLSDHEYDAIAIGVYHGKIRFLETLAVGGNKDNGNGRGKRKRS